MTYPLPIESTMHRIGVPGNVQEKTTHTCINMFPYNIKYNTKQRRDNSPLKMYPLEEKGLHAKELRNNWMSHYHRNYNMKLLIKVVRQ